MHRLCSSAAAGIPVHSLPFRGAPVPRLPLSPSPAPSHSVPLSPPCHNFALPSLLFPLQGSRWPPSGLCRAQRPITGMLMCLSFPSAHRSSPATCISKGTLTRAARNAQSLQWPAMRCDGVSMQSGNARHHLTSSDIIRYHLVLPGIIIWHHLALPDSVSGTVSLHCMLLPIPHGVTLSACLSQWHCSML